MKALECKKIEIGEGYFNLSLLPIDNEEYLGTLRKINRDFVIINQYPELEDHLYFCRLDKDFNLISLNLINDITNRTKHTNYTTGISDVRIFEPNYLSGTTLDTNGNWVSDISLIRLDNNFENIISLIPCRINNLNCGKNWLFIKRNNDKLLFLYKTSPLILMEIDPNTGLTEIVKNTNIPELENLILHNGSLSKLEDGKYLINVRKMNICNRRNFRLYEDTMFLLFDENFNYIKTSKPFKFKETDNKTWTTDDYYEMALSMFIKNNILHCVVTESDKYLYIYKYDLKDIFEN